MKKNVFRSILCLLAILPIATFGATRCECGEFSNGITIYQVNGDDGDCCEDTPLSDAYFTTYSQQNNGVWVLEDVDDSLTGHLAQDDCCNHG